MSPDTPNTYAHVIGRKRNQFPFPMIAWMGIAIKEVVRIAHVHLLARSGFTWAWLILWIVHASASAGDGCFLPVERENKKASSMFIDPTSDVCRAFEAALNATCNNRIPLVEFLPSNGDSLLSLPAWDPIQLFGDDGTENSQAFSLLKALAHSRSVTRHAHDQEARAERDVEKILAKLRGAMSRGEVPRFERTSLDLGGHGARETVFRLFYSSAQNPLASEIASKTISRKTQPELFLQRAVGLPSRGLASAVSPHAAGSEMTNQPSDFVLAEGIPHLLTWNGSRAVLVYSSFANRDRSLTPDEQRDKMSYLIPKLRCIYRYQPTSVELR